MTGEPVPKEAAAPGADDGSPQRQRTVLLGVVGLVLILGLFGRMLVADGVANSFLADWLPWLSGTDVLVFYGDTDGEHLVPVSHNLSGDEENVTALATTLLAGPAAETGLVDLMPPGTSVRSVEHDESVVIVDLSAEFLDDPHPLARYALVQTLASWPDVEVVTLSVEGEELNPVPGRLLFFYDAARDMLVAEPTPATTGRDILAQYLLGPSDSRLIGVPADVDVLQFESAPGSGLIKLNFRYTDSLRDMATQDGDAMRRVLEGLIATLTVGSPDTHFAYLDFEGHATLGLGQCANLLRTVQPLPEVLNDERLIDAS